jgi:hypothetical protein
MDMSDPNNFAPVSQALDGFAPMYQAQQPGHNGMGWAYSSVPYAGPTPDPWEPPKPHTACMYKRDDGDLCRGPRAKGTEFCVGHLRSLAKQAQQSQEAESESE